MKFHILAGDKVIGESDFEDLDPSMGAAHGVFSPSEQYSEAQPVFRLYAEAGTTVQDQDKEKLEEYYRARDALNLTIVTLAGEHVATDCVHITDYSEELGEMEIDAIAADADTFQRFFEVSRKTA